MISDYIFQQTSPLQRLRSKITLKNLRPALPGRQVPLSYVASGKDSVWIIQQNSNTLHVNKTKITGIEVFLNIDVFKFFTVYPSTQVSKGYKKDINFMLSLLAGVLSYLQILSLCILLLLTGHSWTRIKLKGSPTGVRWQTVSAEGIFESGGQLWLLSANGDLYCSQPYNNKNLKVNKLLEI